MSAPRSTPEFAPTGGQHAVVKNLEDLSQDTRVSLFDLVDRRH